jgi:hypothetical protein
MLCKNGPFGAEWWLLPFDFSARIRIFGGGWLDEWTVGWLDGWMNGWLREQQRSVACLSALFRSSTHAFIP